MGETTGISWTDHTANFWLGCTRQSPGCVNCYAETVASGRMGLDVWGPRNHRKPVEGVWANVRKWNRAANRDGVRRRVFCMSMGDFFEPRSEVAEIRGRAWDLIRECDALDWQILTKHAESMRELLPPTWGDGWPHVWLGVSVEDQEWAEKRIPYLLAVPTAVRFLSVEPLLGPVNFRWAKWDDHGPHQRRAEQLPPVKRDGRTFAGSVNELDGLRMLDWVIVGGESGSGHRPMDPAWAVSIRDQCAAAGVAFFWKQASGSRPGMGTMPDGSRPREFPTVRRVERALVAEAGR